MTKSLGIGRGGARPGAGRKPVPSPVPSTDPKLIVEEMVALGETPETIAAALRISVSHLQRNYRDALLHGHARRRCEAISLLFAKARAGSFPAIWKLFQMTGVTAAAEAPERLRQLGKKEAAREEAKTAGAGSDWGDDLLSTDGRSH
ncbi:MAG: hypothetical protein K2X43_09945 [Hyphomonadaceae bacterium]|nr:hypothetical protein [Hyphomonadaceae bacterium]